MNLTPLVIGWAALAAIVAALVVRRVTLGFREDDSIHLATTEIPKEQEQILRSRRISAVDHWGMILTAVVLVYGMVLAGLFVYDAWKNPPGF